ncbi:hypothetical protein CVT26_005386 [Gymnopilus dilepis]|uniref:Uncharacterized protein n=1 Tax=Gymnopilus dilepis TaxID=231916 RepID=A0A409WH35_9AGAR|nr:hypothetical protein CVT26_005386 [Gymnopilus dilepis]
MNHSTDAQGRLAVNHPKKRAYMQIPEDPRPTKRTKPRSHGAPAPRMPLTATKKASAITTRSTTGPSLSFEVENNDLPFNVRISGKQLSPDGANFCIGCKDGGELQLCRTCHFGWCSVCVVFPAGAPCPLCHLYPGHHLLKNGESWGTKSDQPYKWDGQHIFFHGTVPSREMFTPCNGEPLAILSIRLRSIDRFECATETIYHRLFHFLQGNLAYIDMPFDFDGNGIDVWGKQVKNLVKEFTSGKLKRFRRIAAYFVGHSDPERGDLHFTVDNKGASSVSEVFNTIFTTPLLKIIAASQNPTLTLMTCGGVLTHEASLTDLRELAEQGPFMHLIAFEQPRLQIYYLSGLLEKFALNLYVHNKLRLDASLVGEEHTGAHTSIAMFNKAGGTTRYIWAHEVIRPFGQHPALQCHQCAVFRSWKKVATSDSTVIRLQCRTKGCTGFQEFKALSGFTLVKGVNTHGKWYKLSDVD